MALQRSRVYTHFFQSGPPSTILSPARAGRLGRDRPARAVRSEANQTTFVRRPDSSGLSKSYDAGSLRTCRLSAASTVVVSLLDTLISVINRECCDVDLISQKVFVTPRTGPCQCLVPSYRTVYCLISSTGIRRASADLRNWSIAGAAAVRGCL